MTGQELCDLIKEAQAENLQIQGIVPIDECRYSLLFATTSVEIDASLVTSIKIETRRNFWSNF